MIFTLNINDFLNIFHHLIILILMIFLNFNSHFNFDKALYNLSQIQDNTIKKAKVDHMGLNAINMLYYS